MKKISCKKGFTLIEMAIVLMILSIILATGAKIYDLHQKTVAIENTKETVKQLSDAIGDFRSLNGRYPCPASLTATRNSPDYGREQCTDFSDTDPGECKNGVCIEQSLREPPMTYMIGATLEPPTTAEITAKPRVRVGAIPFRNLNMEESDAYDGYGNRVSYAVTEHLAYSDSFINDGGGIEILGDSGTTALSTPATAHFLILSHGANGEGAYTREGVQLPSNAATAEGSNCNNAAEEAVYNYSMGNTGGGASQTDDVMAFFTQRDLPIWQQNPDNRNDLYLKPKGNVGFGFARDSEIPEELTVQRTLRAKNDPDSGTEEGKIQGANLCGHNPSAPECFPTSLIAGKLEEGGGMKCPEGQFIKGIANNQPICETEVKLTCPTGKYMTGVDNLGNIICNVKPPNSCKAESLPIMCEDNVTEIYKDYPLTAHNVTVRKTSLGTRYRDYKCNNGTWVKSTLAGNCFCTPDTTSQGKTYQECSTNLSYDCGKLYNGQVVYQYQFMCPAAQWQNREISRDCTCNPDAFRLHQVSCPTQVKNGVTYSYTSGHQIHISKAICTGSPRCAARTLHENRCVCAPSSRTQWSACPGGLTDANGNVITYLTTQDFVCPDGNSNPGFWTPLVDAGGPTGKDARCVCTPRKLSDIIHVCAQGYRPLPPAQGGPPTTHREIICDGNGLPKTITTETGGCEPIPPPVCTRQPVPGSGGIYGETQKGVMGDGSVTCKQENGGCAEKPTSRDCSVGGPGNYEYFQCTCQQ